MLYAVIIFFVTNFILFLITYKKIAKFTNIYDKPDTFIKKHNFKVPLLGGIIILTNIILIYFLSFQNNFLFFSDVFFSNKTKFIFLLLCFVIFLIGWFDDKKNLSANMKLILTFFIFTFAVLFDKSLIIQNLIFSFTEKKIILENFSIPFTVLCFLLFLNAFNMFDGINLQGSIYALSLLIILYFYGSGNKFILLILIGLLFFINLNFQNKSFLGDSGSLLLATIISFIFILDYNSNYFLADEVFFFLIFPGLDMFRLFIYRIYKGKNPFIGDNNHLHHILLGKFNASNILIITSGSQLLFFSIYKILDVNLLAMILLNIIYYFTLIIIFKKYEKH